MPITRNKRVVEVRTAAIPIPGWDDICRKASMAADDYQYDSDFEKIKCGYPNGKVPRDCQIAKDGIRMMPMVFYRVGYRAGYRAGGEGSVQLKHDIVGDLTDLQFSRVHAAYESFSSSDQLVSILQMPDWLVFAQGYDLREGQLEKSFDSEGRCPEEVWGPKFVRGACDFVRNWAHQIELQRYSEPTVLGSFSKESFERSTPVHFLKELHRFCEENGCDASEALDHLVAESETEYPEYRACKEACTEQQGLPRLIEASFSLHPSLMGLGPLMTQGMQRLEAARMDRVSWPHICLKHPDRRKPQMHQLSGRFMVFDLCTKRDDRFEADPAVVCDEDGKFLPYDEAIVALKSKYDDFTDNSEAAEFFEKNKETDWAADMKATFDDTFNWDRCYGFEIDDSHYFPVMKPADEIEPGKVNYLDEVISVTFHQGPVEWRVIVLPEIDVEDDEGNPAKLTDKEIMDGAAAGYIWNAYSDYAKHSWMVHDGLKDKESDMEYVKKWDPFEDMRPHYVRAFAEFCHEVPKLDGWQNEISRYDGEGHIEGRFAYFRES